MSRWHLTNGWRFMLWAGLVVGALTACQEEKAPAKRSRPQVVAPAEAPPIRVHPNEKGHVYRYFPTGERKPKTSTTIDGVPASVRDLVIVVPEGDMPAGLAYVADLRTAKDDGSFEYRVVPTRELDQALDDARGEVVATEPTAEGAAPADSASDQVVMFSASWCGVCTQARRWFRNKGIEVVERDIEKDKTARSDMLEMAKKAGADGRQLGGVPVIFVNGQMFPGFDPYKIQAALKS